MTLIGIVDDATNPPHRRIYSNYENDLLQVLGLRFGWNSWSQQERNQDYQRQHDMYVQGYFKLRFQKSGGDNL